MRLINKTCREILYMFSTCFEKRKHVKNKKSVENDTYGCFTDKEFSNDILLEFSIFRNNYSWNIGMPKRNSQALTFSRIS